MNSAPTEVVLRPNVQRSLLMLVGCLAFTAASVWFLMSSDGMRPSTFWIVAAVTLFGLAGSMKATRSEGQNAMAILALIGIGIIAVPSLLFGKAGFAAVSIGFWTIGEVFIVLILVRRPEMLRMDSQGVSYSYGLLFDRKMEFAWSEIAGIRFVKVGDAIGGPNNVVVDLVDPSLAEVRYPKLKDSRMAKLATQLTGSPINIGLSVASNGKDEAFRELEAFVNSRQFPEPRAA